MDIARTGQAQKRRRRNIVIAAAGVLLIAAISLGLSRLSPAAPSVERQTVWIDTVQRGSMLRQVRGSGTLVPIDSAVRLISSQVEGRIDRIPNLPGVTVTPETVLMEMSNPEVEQNAAQQSRVDNLEAVYDLRKRQVDALKVKAGMEGVLQEVPVSVGQRVTAGTTLARVARPDQLKAQLRIPETQAKDVRVGQQASIDTRNGVVAGNVSRVAPSVQDGTVLVDVALLPPLPQGARTDLSVDGTIEIERLQNVLYVGRPAYGQADAKVEMFKLIDGGKEAVRVPVKLGRSSVNTIEILSGLKPGDQVILSDTSAQDGFDRIRLN